MNITDKIRNAITEVRITHRGGGLRIDLKDFGFLGYMTAYQNYLGGGMVGRIGSSCSRYDWRDHPELVKLSEEVKKFYYSLKYSEDSESYDEIQARSLQAY